MRDLEALLEALHEELARVLLKKVKGEDASASDLSVARQFLKDNGIDRPKRPGDRDKPDPLAELAEITFENDEEYRPH